MKTKILFAIAFILGITTLTSAQKGGEKREEHKAQKVAFITEQLGLTPAEAKSFWPLYEAKEEAQRSSMKAIKGDRKDTPRKKVEEMTDDEVKTLLDNSIKMKQAQLDIHKEYNTKFLAVLPAKKVAKLYHVEREFRKHKKEGHEGGHEKGEVK